MHSFTFDAVSSWNTVLMTASSLILIARLRSLCMEYFFDINPWLTYSFRQGHQSGSSGTNTPLAEGTTTPESDHSELGVSILNSHTPIPSEKSSRRHSFQQARLVSSIHLHLQSAPLSKEHQEQGRVKIEVYTQYVQAASKFGFTLFLLMTVAQQALSVFATLVLRYWGEHNRKVGGNSGMLDYLLLYGGFSISSILLGALSAITLWVYCALRSARHLHDSVSRHGICLDVWDICSSRYRCYTH